MENQHRKIAGYRELTQTEIDLMNKIKIEGVKLEALIEEVRLHVIAQRDDALGMSHEDCQTEFDRLRKAEPERWASLAKTNLQVGLMELTRAVAQPTFF